MEDFWQWFELWKLYCWFYRLWLKNSILSLRKPKPDIKIGFLEIEKFTENQNLNISHKGITESSKSATNTQVVVVCSLGSCNFFPILNLKWFMLISVQVWMRDQKLNFSHSTKHPKILWITKFIWSSIKYKKVTMLQWLHAWFIRIKLLSLRKNF